MSDTNAPKAGSVTPPSAPEGMEPFQLSAGQRNKLFVSLMVGFFLIFACYASVGAIFMPCCRRSTTRTRKTTSRSS